jgi:hypothetical protein
MARSVLGLGEPRARDVDAGHVETALGEEDAVAALAAADVEHPGARRQQNTDLTRQQGCLGAPDVGLRGTRIFPGPRAASHALIQPT